MKNYNLSIDPTVNEDDVIAELLAKGVVIRQVFDVLNVVCVSSESELDLAVPGVVSIEEDVVVTPIGQVSWQQLRIASPILPMRQTNRSLFSGKGSTVYLVDTAIDKTVPELSTANIVDLWSHDDTFTPDVHGTILARLIVGSENGISPDATLKQVHIPVGNNVSVLVLLQALDEILVDHNATPGVKVVNCSWIINKSQTLDNEIAKLQNAGLIVVAAAGNTGSNADNFSPVGLNSVLGVGASDAYDRVIAWGQGSSSNWGTEVDVTAPGINVELIEDGVSATHSGTSVAAAIVSGVICHFIEEEPLLSAAEIEIQVLALAEADILFRNELIYGTTPNRLIQTHTIRNINPWGILRNTKIPAQRGTSVITPIPSRDILQNIRFEDFEASSRSYKTPSWVEFVNGNIIADVPADLPVGVYAVILSADDLENTYRLPLFYQVFDEDISELDSEVGEQYLTNEGYVRVQLAFCTTNGQCGSFSCCNSTNNCTESAWPCGK